MFYYTIYVIGLLGSKAPENDLGILAAYCA